MKKLFLLLFAAFLAVSCGANGKSAEWFGTYGAQVGNIRAEVTFNADGSCKYVIDGYDIGKLGWNATDSAEKVTIVYGLKNADGVSFKDEMGTFVFDKATKQLTGKGGVVWQKK